MESIESRETGHRVSSESKVLDGKLDILTESCGTIAEAVVEDTQQRRDFVHLENDKVEDDVPHAADDNGPEWEDVAMDDLHDSTIHAIGDLNSGGTGIEQSLETPSTTPLEDRTLLLLIRELIKMDTKPGHKLPRHLRDLDPKNIQLLIAFAHMWTIEKNRLAARIRLEEPSKDAKEVVEKMRKEKLSVKNIVLRALDILFGICICIFVMQRMDKSYFCRFCEGGSTSC